METKRFIGNDMTRLYEKVRREFGSDAVIVRTRTLLRDGAEPLIEIVAAPPNAGEEVERSRRQPKALSGASSRHRASSTPSTHPPTPRWGCDLMATEGFSPRGRPCRSLSSLPTTQPERNEILIDR